MFRNEDISHEIVPTRRDSTTKYIIWVQEKAAMKGAGMNDGEAECRATELDGCNQEFDSELQADSVALMKQMQ